MSKLAESRDDDTGKHLERTRQFCKIIAQQLQKQPAYASLINNTFIDNIYHASPLHDIGKVAIPDSILLKPGELTPDEFKIIKKHALLGATTLQSVHDRYPQNIFITMGVEIARSHHEKWDGSGYPDGLIGDAIPLSAQIMALADVYDALRSKRCYREAFTHAQSCEIIIKGSGTHFAPAIVDAYIVLEQEFDAIHSRTGEIMVE
jgi:putative two-component system response regulator